MENKKTVIVTGAAKGIGADIAMSFAEKGYNVINILEGYEGWILKRT